MTKYELNKEMMQDAINRVEECCAELTTMVITMPHLHIISTSNDGLNGDVANKIDIATKFGIEATGHVVSPQNIMTKLTELSKDLNNKVIIQLPIEDEEDYPRLVEMIELLHPMQDVAGLKVPIIDITSMYDGNDFITHPTFSPGAKAALLLSMLMDAEIEGKEVAIVGKCAEVGLPITLMYNQLNSSVHTINHKSKGFPVTHELCNADLILNCDKDVYLPLIIGKNHINMMNGTVDTLVNLFTLYNCLATQMTNELVMYNDKVKRGVTDNELL